VCGVVSSSGMDGHTIAGVDGVDPGGWIKVSSSRPTSTSSGNRSGRHDDPRNALSLSVNRTPAGKSRPVFVEES